MLDFNHRPSMAERINELIDAALIAERGRCQSKSA